MLSTKKSAGGLNSRDQLSVVKTVVNEDVSDENCAYQTLIEKQVFMHAIGYPLLLQLHSCFQGKSSVVNGDVLRYLLILKFTVSINM
jgi:hypothetical protein